MTSEARMRALEDNRHLAYTPEAREKRSKNSRLEERVRVAAERATRLQVQLDAKLAREEAAQRHRIERAKQTLGTFGYRPLGGAPAQGLSLFALDKKVREMQVRLQNIEDGLGIQAEAQP